MADVEQDFAGEEFDPFDPHDQTRGETKTLSLQEAAEQTIVERLQRRQEAYVRLFAASPEDAKIVLDDLVAFCRGEQAVFHMNERIHVLLTGRQEVYQRIQDHRRLDLDTLVLKYTTPPPQED